MKIQKKLIFIVALADLYNCSSSRRCNEIWDKRWINFSNFYTDDVDDNNVLTGLM
jgi:hypothetical protein